MNFIPFGDSHSIFWANQHSEPMWLNLTPNDPEIQEIFWIGPAKIWGLRNDTVNKTKEKFTLVKEKLSQNKMLIPVACFGEIDLRVNISKQVLLSRNFDLIEEVAQLYLEELSKIDCEQVVIWGPGPSVKDSAYQDFTYACEYPSFGSEFSRNALTHIFNKTIISKINDYPKLKFATIFYDLLGPNLKSLNGALRDVVHISPKHFNLAKEMLTNLASTDAKVAINYAAFSTMPEFEIYENPFPETYNYYQLYKKNGKPPHYQAFVSGLLNSKKDDFSTIEIRAINKIGHFNSTLHTLDETNFVKEFFSTGELSLIEEYVNYSIERLRAKNSEAFDVQTLPESFNATFVLSHFEKLVSICNSSNSEIIISELRSRLLATIAST
jgi:hypothetical protein